MKLICVFVFAYAKRWFSHDAAHFDQGKFRGPVPLKIALPFSPIHAGCVTDGLRVGGGGGLDLIYWCTVVIQIGWLIDS